MKATLLLLLISLLAACNPVQRKQQTLRKTPAKSFHSFIKPIIVQPAIKDTVVCYQLKSLEGCANIFAGKSAFTDTLLIPCKETDFDTAYANDLIREWESEADPDRLSFDSLEVIPDYNTTVLKNEYAPGVAVMFYPVHLINTTGIIKAFAGKDSYTFAIQEAMDKKGNWWPIETRVYDFCGNGTWLLKIRPGEFATILFHKYNGNFKTKLRVRIKNHETMYISQPYEGTINEQQFRLKKSNYLYKRMQKDKGTITHSHFYDAQPLGWR